MSNLRASLPLPDTCTGATPHTHTFDWNPIASASAGSAFAAVLAGFVFAGIVVILSTAPGPDSPERDRAANRATRLLLAAFFTLAVDAYLQAINSGEQVCIRANTQQAMNGGVLALGAVMILLALSWLLITYGREAAIPFARRMIRFALYFIVLMLVTASTGYLDSSLWDGSHTLADWLMRGTGLLAAAGVYWQFRRRQVSALDGNSDVVSDWDKRTSRAAWAGLTFAGLSAAVSGVAMGTPASFWYPTPHLPVYAVAWASLVFPLVAVIVSVPALAGAADALRPSAPLPGQAGGSQQPTGQPAVPPTGP